MRAESPASVLEGPRLHTLIYIFKGRFSNVHREISSLYDVLYVKQTGNDIDCGELSPNAGKLHSFLGVCFQGQQ